MNIFFSVGEPSGDLHGANLVRAMRQSFPQLHCVGFGGPKMRGAGCELLEDLTQFAVMWFVRVLLNLHRFVAFLAQADRYFRTHHVDAVVLIDYPGFNWWIARRARAHGIPVFYYGAPQMWGWAGWRVKKMRRLVDHVLCKLPFEADWYQQRKCNASHVGHPYFDELRQRSVTTELPEGSPQSSRDPANRPLVAILPGSRTQEVQSNLDAFLQTALRIHQVKPETRFAIASFNREQARMARTELKRFFAGQNPRPERLDIDVYCDRTADVISAATVCLACSGSVSLELLYHEKPSIIHYRVSRLAFWIQQQFRRVRYISLVNLLASENRYCERGELYDPNFEEVPFPEYLTWQDRSSEMSADLLRLLEDRTHFENVLQQLREMRTRYAHTGASQTAARYILHHVMERRNQSAMDRPHFQPRRVA